MGLNPVTSKKAGQEEWPGIILTPEGQIPLKSIEPESERAWGKEGTDKASEGVRRSLILGEVKDETYGLPE